MRIGKDTRVVYAGQLHGVVLEVNEQAGQAMVRFPNGTTDWFRLDLMVPEGDHDPQEETPGSWRDRAGFLWLETEPGSERLFCYDRPVRRRMSEAWRTQGLAEVEAEFGPLDRMAPAPREAAGDPEARYMLQFRHRDEWVNYWSAPVPLETVGAMGGFRVVLGLVPGMVRLVAWIPSVVASTED